MSQRWMRLSATALVALLGSMPILARAEWKVDLSRRQKVMRDHEVQNQRANPNAAETDKGLFDVLFESGEPLQELVILNTEKGFLPSTIRMRKGAKYLIHVVNVNEKEKNISFVLDAFSEHHSTFYGKVKSFRVEPKKEGVYSYQCPETSVEGRVVVYASGGSSVPPTLGRGPASEEEK